MNGGLNRMAKYNVHGGHNSIVPGAASILNEVTEDRKVKNELISLLKNAGHTVYDCTDDSGRTAGANLANIVAKCNKHSVDLDISIHLNAGRNDSKGDGSTGGVEVFCYNSKTKSVAEKIVDAIADEFGYHNRGVKYSTGLYVLRNTESKAILIECCFVDDKDDAKVWDAEKCAAAIYKGLTGKVVKDENDDLKPGQLLINGAWAAAVTRRAQRVYGVTVDGIVGGQSSAQKKYFPACSTSSWLFNADAKGDPLITAMQRDLQKRGYYTGEVNGVADKALVLALQKFLIAKKWVGVKATGTFDKSTCKAFQRWLNKQDI